MGGLFLFRMVPTILLLVISTALAAPRANMTEDYMEGSEDNSGNSSEGSHDYLEGAHDYMVGPEDYSGNNTDYLEGPEDYSGNYTDYLEGAILERSNSLLEDRAINTCGCAPVSSSNRIVGGKEVNPKGKLSYQVCFNPCKCNSDGMCRCGMCGGTIVNKKFVITAAHCYNSMFTDLRVIVGEHNLCDGVNEGGKVIKVKKITLHPDYNSRTVDNDIAVLELAEDLTFTKKIKPACLPSSETKDYSGSASTVSGWGGTIGYGPNDQQPQQPRQCTLKETIVKLIASSDPMCSKLPGLATSSKIKLCAFAKDTDTCQGDSGGPLTVSENGKYTLVGVVSYGWGCASSTPGIYARVQGFLPWIKNLISSGECSGSSSSSGGATTAKPTTAKATTTASSNGNYDYYSYYG